MSPKSKTQKAEEKSGLRWERQDLKATTGVWEEKDGVDVSKLDSITMIEFICLKCRVGCEREQIRFKMSTCPFVSQVVG